MTGTSVGLRPTSEQLQLERVILGATAGQPKPIGVEVADGEIFQSSVKIRTYCHQKYREALSLNELGLLGFVERCGVLNLGDKFNATISTLYAPFSDFNLTMEGHPQLGGGLGVKTSGGIWLFFQSRRNDWDVVGEAVNFVVMANMVFLVKKAYCEAIQRSLLPNINIIPSEVPRSMAVITNCFECFCLSRWVEKVESPTLLRLARLFY